MTRKQVSFHAVCFPLVFLEKKFKENLLFSVNAKNISSNVLKISENSLVLRTREFTDIFITFDETYLVFTSKKVNILYILSSKDDLFINITVSRAFHTVKFELDNERHFHARITINMIVVLLFYVHDKHLRSCRDGQLT